MRELLLPIHTSRWHPIDSSIYLAIELYVRVRTRVRIRVRIRVRTRVRTIGLGFEFRVTYLKNSVIIPAASKSFRGLWNQASWKSVACCE